jgi:outer membrane protein OmpA-like peptidoglycan-associated protein
VQPPAAAPAAPAAPEAAQQADTAEDKPPSIPLERRQFKDDGRYPNLAQVPSRPTDLPTFAEAAALRKTLEADRAQGGAAASAPVQTAAVPVATSAVASRAEDRTPCMGAPGSGQPTATLHFAQGSSALTADERGALAEAIPTVRGSEGTVRILGHGDADPGAQGQRFDLAMARASAVAQALAGLGIPVTRLAIGVGCTDTAAAGASVQLYLQS